MYKTRDYYFASTYSSFSLQVGRDFSQFVSFQTWCFSFFRLNLKPYSFQTIKFYNAKHAHTQAQIWNYFPSYVRMSHKGTVYCYRGASIILLLNSYIHMYIYIYIQTSRLYV